MRAVGIPCHQDDTARFTVKTGDGAEDEGRACIAVGKCVGKSVLVVSVRGVRGHSRLLVAQNEGVVLVQDG